jgi:methylamine---glutamate N-methyltransferase subunit B
VAALNNDELTAVSFDLEHDTVRALNAELHRPAGERASSSYEVRNPRGAHAVAAGIHDAIAVHVRGHAGYYCAGMNDGGDVLVDGSVGTGVAENMMSGTVRVRGDASQSAGATAHGGLLVVEGNASMRCGISLKGADVVVGGSVGASCGFMAQAGRIVVCGDAADGLGDSVYETRIYVRGSVGVLGADCVAKPMRDEHRAELAELLAAAGLDHDVESFRRYGSARTLYHWGSH